LAGVSRIYERTISSCRTGWLTWEDSNFHIPISKNAFEMSAEFPLFCQKLDSETFAAASCRFRKHKPVKYQAECLEHRLVNFRFQTHCRLRSVLALSPKSARNRLTHRSDVKDHSTVLLISRCPKRAPVKER
jgi:hypothetical protein